MVASYYLFGVGGIAVGLALSEALVFLILLPPARSTLAGIAATRQQVAVDAL
jgi:hypothetical protein